MKILLSFFFVLVCLTSHSQSKGVEDFPFTISDLSELDDLIVNLRSHFMDANNFGQSEIQSIETFVTNTLNSLDPGAGNYETNIRYKVETLGTVGICLSDNNRFNVALSHYDISNNILTSQNFFGNSYDYIYPGYAKNQLHIIAAISFDRFNLKTPSSANFIITDMDKL